MKLIHEKQERRKNMYPNLRAELARKGMTLTELAKETGMSLNVLSGRVNGKYEFTYSETLKIKKALGVDIPLEILFERAV
jgi:transcriptional regulator with XRE-family HTH domain